MEEPKYPPPSVEHIDLIYTEELTEEEQEAFIAMRDSGQLRAPEWLRERLNLEAKLRAEGR